MPFSYAHYVLLLFIPLVVIAFWPFYFSQLAASPVAIHVHGVTASAWILLLVFQSWAIHNRRIGLHRAAGRASFVLFPLFLVGGFLVLHSMAIGTAVATNPFVVAFGPGLGALDLLAVSAFAGLYLGALRHRREVQLHARFMLATPLLLLSPVFARLINSHVPGLIITGPEQMHLFPYSVQLANLVAVVVALALYASAPRYGRPFLWVVAVVLAQSTAFQWLGALPGWRASFVSLAALPVAAPVLLGLGLGAFILWHGLSGGRPGTGRRASVESV